MRKGDIGRLLGRVWWWMREGIREGLGGESTGCHINWTGRGIAGHGGRSARVATGGRWRHRRLCLATACTVGHAQALVPGDGMRRRRRAEQVVGSAYVAVTAGLVGLNRGSLVLP